MTFSRMAFQPSARGHSRPDGMRAASLARTGGAGAADAILRLQCMAGNRAVTALIQGGLPGSAPQRDSLQRTIATNVRDLDIGRSDRVREGLFEGTYSKIIRALGDYHQRRDKRERLFYVDVIIGLTGHWLAAHAASTTPKSVRRRPLLMALRGEALVESDNLRAEVNRETTNRKAEDVYLSDLQHGRFTGAAQFGDAAADVAKDVAGGKASKTMGGDQIAVDLVAKYGLTAAELAAIRLYTLPDYVYINPATANSEGWMKSNLADTKDMYDFKTGNPKKLKEEGSLHAGTMLQGLAKMDVAKGITYRGARMTKAKFLATYQQGGTYTFGSFGSTAKKKSKARKFADGLGGNKDPGKHETTSVMAILEVRNGRDISMLSTIRDEEEILLLPGAKFKVDVVKRYGTGNAGNTTVPAKRWFTVEMTQTE